MLETVESSNTDCFLKHFCSRFLLCEDGSLALVTKRFPKLYFYNHIILEVSDMDNDQRTQHYYMGNDMFEKYRDCLRNGGISAGGHWSSCDDGPNAPKPLIFVSPSTLGLAMNIKSSRVLLEWPLFCSIIWLHK